MFDLPHDGSLPIQTDKDFVTKRDASKPATLSACGIAEIVDLMIYCSIDNVAVKLICYVFNDATNASICPV